MEDVKVLILDTGDSVAVCLETPEAITCQTMDDEHAIRLLRDGNHEVAICNLEATGVELDTIGRIKESCPNVQVVVLSPTDDADIMARAKELGAYEVLHKPEAGVLNRIVKAAAEYGRTVSKSLEASRLSQKGQYEEAAELFRDKK